MYFSTCTTKESPLGVLFTRKFALDIMTPRKENHYVQGLFLLRFLS
jgi:hypothetical protein